MFLLAENAKDKQKEKYLQKNLKIDNIYRAHEDFLDIVYGAASLLKKEEWEIKVATEAKWFLKQEHMVNFMYDLLQRPKLEDKIAEKPEFKARTQLKNKL